MGAPPATVTCSLRQRAMLWLCQGYEYHASGSAQSNRFSNLAASAFPLSSREQICKVVINNLAAVDTGEVTNFIYLSCRKHELRHENRARFERHDHEVWIRSGGGLQLMRES